MAGERNTTPRLRRATKSTMKSVYLKPGLPEDELLIAVWNAASRPTQLFRTLLLQGVKRMVERGELPAQIATNHAVKRHLGAVGELTPAMPVQVPLARLGAPSFEPPSPVSTVPASEPEASSPQPSPQKDAPSRRAGLDATLM
jgi:hypothetical protein